MVNAVSATHKYITGHIFVIETDEEPRKEYFLNSLVSFGAVKIKKCDS